MNLSRQSIALVLTTETRKQNTRHIPNTKEKQKKIPYSQQNNLHPDLVCPLWAPARKRIGPYFTDWSPHGPLHSGYSQ